MWLRPRGQVGISLCYYGWLSKFVLQVQIDGKNTNNLVSLEAGLIEILQENIYTDLS